MLFICHNMKALLIIYLLVLGLVEPLQGQIFSKILNNDSTCFYDKNYILANTGISIGFTDDVWFSPRSGAFRHTEANWNNSFQLGYLRGKGNQAYGVTGAYYNHVYYRLGVVTLSSDYRRFLSKKTEKGFFIQGQAGLSYNIHNWIRVRPRLGYHFYAGFGYSRKTKRNKIISWSTGLQATQVNYKTWPVKDNLGNIVIPSEKVVIGLRRLDLVRYEILF